MIPKFKAGDLVWAWSDGTSASPGEHAAQIIQPLDSLCPGHADHHYRVDVFDTISLFGGWIICESFLRPRRDDYQQREPLGSRKDLDKPLAEEFDTETAVFIVRETYKAGSNPAPVAGAGRRHW